MESTESIRHSREDSECHEEHKVSEYCVKVDEELTDWFIVTAGIRQGWRPD